MVARFQVNKQRQFVVVDFDGTLIEGNSLIMFIVYSFRLLVRRGRFSDSWGVFRAVVERKIRRISHREMKFRILSVLHKVLSEEDIQGFVQLLVKKVNPKVKQIIDDASSCGQTIILATAAPDIYISKFAACQGLDYFIATDMTDDIRRYKESRGEIKKERVEKLVDSLRGEVSTVITDHLDDIPLLLYCKGANMVVSPDEKTLLALKKNKVEYNLV